MPSKQAESWAVVNVMASDLPLELVLEQEMPVSIVATDDSLEMRWDFKRQRTRSKWNIWLSAPKGRQRRGGIPILQMEMLPTTDQDSQQRLELRTYECKKRFELFLRLARSRFFVIDAWQHRGHLRSKYSSYERPYSIDRTVQALIPLLNEKLRSFLWDQWLLAAFRFEEEMKKYARNSLEEWELVRKTKAGVVASTHFLQTALSYYSKALTETFSETDQVIVEANIALEALITDEDEKGELQFKLARRIASLVADDPLSQKSAFDFLKRFYDLRSKIVHGSTKAEALGVELKPEIPRLLEYTRVCLLYFLALRDMPKKQILEKLDYGTFDLHELAELKARAWNFWGKDNWPRLADQTTK